MVDIPLWESDRTVDYLLSRLDAHRDSKVAADFKDALPPCSPEERWMSETIYAVKRDGRKTAIRVFKDSTEAQNCADEETRKGKGKAYVEIRPAEPKRCTGDYCGVAKWCDQYQTEVANEAGTHV